MIRFSLKKFTKDNSGTSALELALLSPVIILMLVAAVDYGSAYVRQMEITNAVKAGIQYAMVMRPVTITNVNADTNEVTVIADIESLTSAEVNSHLASSSNDTTTIVSNLYCTCGGTEQLCTATCVSDFGAYMEVTVSETFVPPLLNYNWLPDGYINLSSSSTIKINSK
ncbi:TadE/TadG family type IV pilus assembly protein [Pseudemcibacter aquimaris]|uniref:TadE/TadG family type IV pilus assembly protein n=1 Tax=Pseudemcibacter aquimaris TaxID=2857064 RepID=UPI002010D43B|nr:TadE/TadG family type IV pilus assembly protein [Pseudemcibacter aquimaris]MCC3862232.1 pilus assembly protein [Pseudemcibacter aquimaris]WDU58984.1 pilus assembly protein [Pseudemcibacter aquimaris]